MGEVGIGVREAAVDRKRKWVKMMEERNHSRINVETWNWIVFVSYTVILGANSCFSTMLFVIMLLVVNSTVNTGAWLVLCRIYSPKNPKVKEQYDSHSDKISDLKDNSV